MRGRFITFEGPEGSGKTTQTARLVKRLRGVGLEVETAREPGGTPLGEAIRHVLQHDSAGETMCAETETLLFAASRAQLVRSVIMPALERGAWFVCDRFMDSTTAYQGYGRQLDIERILGIHSFTVGRAVPDVTILLDLDVRRGFDRLRKRNAEKKTGFDRIEREDISFHEKVRAGYLELAKKWPERFRVIDADRSADAVESDVWKALENEPKLGLKSAKR